MLCIERAEPMSTCRVRRACKEVLLQLVRHGVAAEAVGGLPLPGIAGPPSWQLLCGRVSSGNRGRRSAADTPVGLTEAMCAAVKQTTAVMALLLFAVLFGYEPRCCLALGALFVMYMTWAVREDSAGRYIVQQIGTDQHAVV